MTRGITDAGIAIGAAAALALGVWRVSHGLMSIEALLIVLMAGTEVFRPLRDLRSVLHQGMVGQSAAAGIHALLAGRAAGAGSTGPHSPSPALRERVDRQAGAGRVRVPPSEAAGPPPHPDPLPRWGRGSCSAVPALAPTIEFDDVHFAYPGGRRPAHDGLSFAVAAGEKIGIVGPSGSGKSSVARLLLRLFDPQSGAVRVGGHDLRNLDPEVLRGLIAVVHQDTYLFHGTVEENLRLGRPDATQAELEQAARDANAHEFILQLPQGYQTIIGERGVNLSGGQRQRLAIARALLRDSPILILDEALSSVDAENEAVIQQALDRLAQGRTTLDPGAPAVERDRRRPHPRARPRPRRRERQACRADPPRRSVPPADGGAGRGARRRSRPRDRGIRRDPRRGGGDRLRRGGAGRDRRQGRAGRRAGDAAHAGPDHRAVAPAVRHRRHLGHRPGRGVYRRRHRRRAGGRRGQDRSAVRLLC